MVHPICLCEDYPKGQWGVWLPGSVLGTLPGCLRGLSCFARKWKKFCELVPESPASWACSFIFSSNPDVSSGSTKLKAGFRRDLSGEDLEPSFAREMRFIPHLHILKGGWWESLIASLTIELPHPSQGSSPPFILGDSSQAMHKGNFHPTRLELQSENLRTGCCSGPEVPDITWSTLGGASGLHLEVQRGSRDPSWPHARHEL